MNLRAVLKHHRCWTWVKGTNETPLPKQIKAEGSGPADPDVDNPAYATWEEGASDAFYHILLTCKPKVQDQIADICIPAIAWKRLKDFYEPSNLSTQFDHLSTIWNISLDDHTSVTDYCSALELTMTRYLASGPIDMWHMLSLIALMRLPSSYKVTQCTILSKAGPSVLLMDSIKGDLLTEERMLACENKQTEKNNAAMQAQAQKSNKSNLN